MYFINNKTNWLFNEGYLWRHPIAMSSMDLIACFPLLVSSNLPLFYSLQCLFFLLQIWSILLLFTLSWSTTNGHHVKIYWAFCYILLWWEINSIASSDSALQAPTLTSMSVLLPVSYLFPTLFTPSCSHVSLQSDPLSSFQGLSSGRNSNIVKLYRHRFHWVRTLSYPSKLPASTTQTLRLTLEKQHFWQRSVIFSHHLNKKYHHQQQQKHQGDFHTWSRTPKLETVVWT